MRCTHWYHVWAGGEWRAPVTEHLAVLAASGFNGPFYWGAVGTDEQIAEVTDLIGRPPAVSAPTGFEQVTLTEVRRYAKTHQSAVMYAHTKGAADTSEFRARWRRSMELRVVDNWRANVRELAAHDVVGCHWLTRDVFPGMVSTPFFGGNYWIARCDYLRTLPALETTDRFEAERWIGLGSPRVVDLCPGWPMEELFTTNQGEA